MIGQQITSKYGNQLKVKNMGKKATTFLWMQYLIYRNQIKIEVSYVGVGHIIY
jgi:hypothetical protein